MAVDVRTETVIERPLEVVSAYAGDPSNAPARYANIESVNWKTPPPLRVGSDVAFVAPSSGDASNTPTSSWSSCLESGSSCEQLQGPFPMETTYTRAPAGEGSTRTTLRNRGEPAGFSRVVAPFMAAAVRRANPKDLAKMTAILEAG